MSTPNPLIPQGSLLDQEKPRNKSNLFIAVTTIVAVHVMILAGVLMFQGCRGGSKPPETASLEMTNAQQLLDTNLLATSAPPLVATGQIAQGGVSSNYFPGLTQTQEIPQQFGQSNISAFPETQQATAKGQLAGGYKEYTVVKGDSFYKIAKDHGISVSALANANPGVDSRKLKPGQVLQIPVAQQAKSETTEVPQGVSGASTTASASELTVYTVKAGDTLSKIAKAHGVTVNAIREANSLKTDRIHIGQKLKIPAKRAGATKSANTSNTLPTDMSNAPMPVNMIR